MENTLKLENTFINSNHPFTITFTHQYESISVALKDNADLFKLAETYKQLLDQVCQAANALKELGVKQGDRVAIYMPMIPQAAVAMLACARLGAMHSVVFGGFSADSLLSRIQDADASLVITADGGYRKGAAFALKPAVDEALKGETNVKNVLVVKRTGQEVSFGEKDIWWHEIVDRQSTDHNPEFFDS